MATNMNNESYNGDVICYSSTMVTTNGIWQGEDPLSFSLPLLILQVIVVVLTTRILVVLLRPINQPRVLAEIVAGIVLGPSLMGKSDVLGPIIFPEQSIAIVETLAHLGLLYFLFLVGLEMDIEVIKRTRHKALSIAVAGMAIPFIVGTATSFVFRNFFSHNIHQASFLVFLGVALSVTAFPVLARILAETKLLNTDVGRISMSAAVINDMCAWILLALSIALTDEEGSTLSSLWVLLSGIVFFLFCLYVVRPAMFWLTRKLPEGQGLSEFQVTLILSGVILAGLTTDAIGIHSVFGAFVYGLVIPNGILGLALIEKMEDFVTGLMLPLYFVISGLRTDLSKVQDEKVVGLLVLVFVLASIGKIGATVVLALFYGMPVRHGLALGFLMNTRGLVEMIVLNIGRDKQVLDDESFAVLVVVSLAMTALVTPALKALYSSPRRNVSYKRRKIQKLKPTAELRILVGVHDSNNISSVISFLELSNPTKKSPVFIYVLHLIELTDTASMVIVHNANISNSGDHRKCQSSQSSNQTEPEQVVKAFHQYEKQAVGVSVETLTAVSPLATMHEDIYNIAEEGHVALIILPFHNQQVVEGSIEVLNSSISMLNENILKTAPCSVGLLIDRGLTSTHSSQAHKKHHVSMLFFGGPDDREALAYAWRMVDNQAIHLTVQHFILNDKVTAPQPQPSSELDSRVITIATENTREKQLDEEYVSEFQQRNSSNECVTYTENIINNKEEIVRTIQAMSNAHKMHIVGRGQGNIIATMMMLSESMEWPELGPVGNMLVSLTTVSVLVVQQYVGHRGVGNTTDDGVDHAVQQYLNNANQRASVVAGTHRATGGSFNFGWNGK